MGGPPRGTFLISKNVTSREERFFAAGNFAEFHRAAGKGKRIYDDRISIGGGRTTFVQRREGGKMTYNLGEKQSFRGPTIYQTGHMGGGESRLR